MLIQTVDLPCYVCILFKSGLCFRFYFMDYVSRRTLILVNTKKSQMSGKVSGTSQNDCLACSLHNKLVVLESIRTVIAAKY